MSATPPKRVFVGVSGASGALYAVRLVRSLAAAGCGLQLSISESGVLVLRHELDLAAEGRHRNGCDVVATDHAVVVQPVCRTHGYLRRQAAD